MEVICRVADAFLCGATFSHTGTIQSLSSKVTYILYIVHESPEFCKFRHLKTTLVECSVGNNILFLVFYRHKGWFT